MHYVDKDQTNRKTTEKKKKEEKNSFMNII